MVMRSIGIRRAWTLLAITTVLLVAVDDGKAEEAFCMKCQADRWQTLDAQFLQRSANLKNAHTIRRQAQQRGDPILIQRAQGLVDRAAAEWQYVDKTAQAVNGPTYKAFLERHQADVDTRYNEARAQLHRRTEEFDRLRKALGRQKETTLKEMEGILRQVAQEHVAAGVDLFCNSVQAAGGQADMIAKEWRAANIAPDRIRSVESFARFAKGLETGRVAGELYKKEYWRGVTEGGRLLLVESIPWLLSGTQAAVAMGAATGLPLALELALDVTAISLSYDEFQAAEERLQGVRNIELAWQTDIQALGARVQTLEAERALAADAIRRQKAFERQVQQIRKEMNP